MQTSSPLFWSLPVGSLFATRIRISLYFPLLLLILVAWFDPKIAFALTGIFLISTLFHELVGHVLIARSTGGDGSEVLLWPIGGLAWVQPAPTFWSQFMTAAGGPLVNLAICLLIFPALLWIPGGTTAFNPFTIPLIEFSENWVQDMLVLGFFVNWMLALVNLLPIYPLDGGRMVEACLIGHGTITERKLLCLRIGMIAAVIIATIGLMLDNVLIVFFASMLLVLNVLESVQVQYREPEESFLGYDFSQGYTSLERHQAETRTQRKSFFQRWRDRRKAERERLKEEQTHLEAERLDELLAKVHAEGFEALTPYERKFLDRTSKNLRTKK